jgi:hypothetical protein
MLKHVKKAAATTLARRAATSLATGTKIHTPALSHALAMGWAKSGQRVYETL